MTDWLTPIEVCDKDERQWVESNELKITTGALKLWNVSTVTTTTMPAQGWTFSYLWILIPNTCAIWKCSTSLGQSYKGRVGQFYFLVCVDRGMKVWKRKLLLSIVFHQFWVSLRETSFVTITGVTMLASGVGRLKGWLIIFDSKISHRPESTYIKECVHSMIKRA